MTSVLLARRVGRLLLAACVLNAGVLSAQVPTAPTDTAKRLQVLFTLKDAALAAGVVGATVALFPVDRSMAQRLQNESSSPGKLLNHWSTAFDYVALPGVFVVAPALYAVGRLGHNPDLEDLGWHTTEAAIVGTGITEILKGLVGRSRPYVTADTNPHDFRFGRGFTSAANSSFPSGHATIAFAAAAAATSEVQRMWPRYTWIVGPFLYGSAALVGLARMYQSQHWASDVVLGAGIGTFSGLKVVRYTHAHPDNYLDRILLHTRIAPNPGGGGTISWSAPLP
jgi:membrane-associated phospholipid phosphatase